MESKKEVAKRIRAAYVGKKKEIFDLGNIIRSPPQTSRRISLV